MQTAGRPKSGMVVASAFAESKVSMESFMGMRTAAVVDKLDLIREHIPVVDSEEVDVSAPSPHITHRDNKLGEEAVLSSGTESVRTKARRVYEKIVHHSPMRKQDAWNWMAQILDIPIHRARIEELTPTQYLRVVKKGEQKIEEYKKRGKWRDEPRENPWRYNEQR